MVILAVYMKHLFTIWILPTLGLFSSALLASEQGESPPPLLCSKEVFQVLDTWPIPQGWANGLSTQKQERFVQAPTKKVGTWIRIRSTNSYTTAQLISPSEEIQIQWRPPQCNPVFQTQRRPLKSAVGFDDAKLITLIEDSEKKHFSGMIYAWSSQMPISILGLKEAENIAKEFSLKFVVTVDSNAPSIKVRQAIRENNFKNANTALLSEDLVRRGMGIHFPSLILFKNGTIARFARHGYDQPDILRSFIRAWQKE